MCGFLCVIDKKGNVIDEEACNDALQLQKHRGPDGWHFVVNENVYLGHVRLSIIDPNDVASQPFRIGNWLIIFNGEIYNFEELKNELIACGVVFVTSSDTEVLLAGFIYHGKSFFDRIEGMFAIVIFNEATRHLWVHRDDTGQKPLYVLETDEILILSSSLKSIKSLVPDLTVCNESIKLYLHLSFLPQPHTIYKGVKKIFGGEIRHYIDGELIKSQICRKNTQELNLRKVIQESTRSDVPVALSLSAGLDSSLIASIVANDLDKVFHLKSKPSISYLNDDTNLVERFCQEKNLDLTLVDQLELTIENINGWITNMDEPFGDSSALQSLQIAEMASKKGIKVVLTGDGADELFGGYRKHKAFILISLIGRFANLIMSFIPRNYGSKLSRSLKVSKDKNKLYLELSNMGVSSHVLSKSYGTHYLDEIVDILNLSISNLNDVIFYDRTLVLEGDMLVKSDRSYMIHGVESRPVFANSRFGIHKYVQLLSSFKVLFFGKSHIKRLAKYHLPSYILNKKKSGFDLSFDELKVDDMVDFFETYFARIYCSNEYLKNIYDLLKGIEDKSTHRYKRDLYVFYVLIKWLDLNEGAEIN